MINTKVKIYMLFLIVFFAVRWWILNRDFIPLIDETGINILNDMASSYSGYNDIYVHGSAYTMFFLLLLNLLLPNWNAHILVRTDRVKYFTKLFLYMTLACALFVFIFHSIAVTGMSIAAGVSVLVDWGYYNAVFPMLILTFLYYVLMGAVFLFFYVVLKTKTKALFAAYFVSVILLGLPYYIKLPWTPLASLVVVDDMLEHRFHVATVLLDALKLSLFSMFFYMFSMHIFKGKDILGKDG